MTDSRSLVVCTVKNEGAFLLEWLAWNRLIGFTDFLIFQNGSVDGTKELLQLLSDYGLINYRDNDGVNFVSPQRYSYRKASQSDLFKASDWVIALDIDEFMRIDVPGGKVPDLLATYPEDADEIRLNWRNFGNSGQHHLADGLVIERFTETFPEEAFDRFTFPTKTIFRPSAFSRIGVHSPKDHKNTTWKSYNGSGDQIEEPENVAVGVRDSKRLRRASIHHYIVKDADNFVLKCDRGKSGHPNREMKTRYWHHWNARGRIDETLKAQADRVRREIARIDMLCDGKALPIHEAAMQWRRTRYAELVRDPQYAEVRRDIALLERQEVPPDVAKTLAAAAEPATKSPAATDTQVAPPAQAIKKGPNLDFDLIKQQAQQNGGEWHETEHHVVVHVPGRERLVFGFDNLSSMSVPGPRLPWAYDLARSRDWGVLGVMVKRNDWFRSDPLFDVLEALRDRGVYARYPSVSMYGASMGAFGATAFAPLAPGCTVLAFAPQSTLSNDLAPFERRYSYARKHFDWSNPRYRDGASGIRAAGKAYIVYDQTIAPDAEHAQRLLGDNVTDLGWPFLTHKIPPRLKLMKVLKTLSLEGLEGSLTRERFCSLLRMRRGCNAYLIDMLNGAIERGHLKLARGALDQVLHSKNNWRTRQLSRQLNRQLAGSAEKSPG